MNSKQTCLSIDAVLTPLLHKTRFKNYKVLMDNAAPHTSKETKEFMESQGIEYIEFGGGKHGEKGGFPPNSPDLNPIENIFGILQANVNEFQPSTVGELIKVVERCWEQIDMKHIISTIRSLKKRMKFVLENNGDIFK